MSYIVFENRMSKLVKNAEKTHVQRFTYS